MITFCPYYVFEEFKKLLEKSQLKVHFRPAQKRCNMNRQLKYYISIEPVFFKNRKEHLE